MVLRKLSQTFKIGLAAALSVLSSGILQAMPASAYSLTNPDGEYKKVWVCKYVGTPGVNETLKHGNDGLVSVNTSSISNDENDDIELGDEFTDRHERSVVVAWDNKGPAPSTELCPEADSGDNDVTPLPSGINDICGPNNDTVPSADTATYEVTNDSGWINGSRTITYEAADGFVFSTSEGWTVSENGKTATYTYTDWATPCNTPIECIDPDNGGVITDNTAGWTLVGDAEFVETGVSINSDNWNDGGISFTSTYSVAEVQNLNWALDTTGVTGTYGVGILLETGDGDIIHYEPGPYTDDFWSNSPVLPANAGGQGGPYSGSLQDLLDTIGNVDIVKTTFVFTSADANEGVLLTSLSFNCTTYTFEKAPRVPTECTVSNNRFIEPWTYDEVTYPEAEDYSDGAGGTIENTATFDFKEDGLHLSTPDANSSVYGLIDAGETLLQDVDNMSYETFRKTESGGYQYTAPAYILVVDTNGTDVTGGMKYFFYEPYNNAPPAVTENEWQTWDAINEGQAKWWMSGTNQALRTWEYFVSEFPKAVVLAYGFNQGTSNAETYSIVQDLEFDCATTTFASPSRGGGNNGGDDDDDNSGNVGGVSTEKPTGGKVLGTSMELPATIPATGGASNPFLIIIASLVAYGAAYFLQGRRLLGKNSSLSV